MKLNYAGNEHTSAGLGETTAFTFNMSATAFDILATGVYSDKILAVQREYACNASDAHTMSGYPERPIEVHMPIATDPTFRVRDYGNGLTKPSMKRLLAGVFSSDKRHSDELIGGMGIGFMSGFAYTDSFIVTSVADDPEQGKRLRTIGIAARGADGIPTLEFADQEETTDPTGTVVEIAVKNTDFNEFNTKCERLMRWFTVLPTVQNLPKPLEAPAFKWKADVGTLRYGYLAESEPKTTGLVMGGVFYPINANRLGAEREHLTMLADGLVIWGSVGTAKIAVSREELQYDEASRASLIAALDALGAHVAAKVFEIAAEPRSRWQLRNYVLSLGNSFNEIKALQHLLSVYAPAGTSPERVREVAKIAVSPTAELSNAIGDAASPVTVQIVVPGTSNRSGGEPRMQRVVHGHVRSGTADIQASVMVHPKTIVMIGDASHSSERAKTYVRALQRDKIAANVVLVSAGAAKSATVLAERDLIAEKIVDELGGLPIVKSSTIQPERIQETKRADGKKVRTTLIELPCLTVSDPVPLGTATTSASGPNRFFLPTTQDTRTLRYNTRVGKNGKFANRERTVQLMKNVMALTSQPEFSDLINVNVFVSCTKSHGEHLAKLGYTDFLDEIQARLVKLNARMSSMTVPETMAVRYYSIPSDMAMVCALHFIEKDATLASFAAKHLGTSVKGTQLLELVNKMSKPSSLPRWALAATTLGKQITEFGITANPVTNTVVEESWQTYAKRHLPTMPMTDQLNWAGIATLVGSNIGSSGSSDFRDRTLKLLAAAEVLAKADDGVIATV